MPYNSKTFAPAGTPGSAFQSSVSSHSISSMAAANSSQSNQKDDYTEMTSEFSSKRWVWVPDIEIAFIMGFVTYDPALQNSIPGQDGHENPPEQLKNVTDVPEGHLKIRCVDDSDRIVPSHAVSPANPPKFELASDMAELTHLNEASVIHNLRARYMKDLIYTYSGLFLVAINPYKDLGIYGEKSISLYRASSRRKSSGAPHASAADTSGTVQGQLGKIGPHIYAITDKAFHNMLEEHENQSILVTGESGAGKTENTKKVIQYLAAITSSRGNSILDTSVSDSSSSGPSKKTTMAGQPVASSFEQKIIQANPILEAFGNAQTVRNNNSSRFGKFIRIEFGRSGQIAGASIYWYLLEKSRVIYQNSKERNYHIFYQLFSGLPSDLKNAIMLDGTPSEYSYLKDSKKIIEGVDDHQEFKSLLNSFRIMGFTTQEQTDLFRIMSAVLNIGNIEIGAERSDQARILNVTQVERVCHLLGVSAETFSQGLLRPKVKAGREWVRQSRSAQQVRNSLDALAKSLYERTFSAIVDRINDTLDRGRTVDRASFIGVLDIAGFEIFENNSFEQLCINYTNEKLQQFFNHHMFVLEQEEYNRENIAWKYIDFGHDLQPTIDLIEKSNPIGIFSCLDEECVMPKATDKSFTDKLNHLWDKKSPKYRSSRLSQGFVLTHYAAEVEYSTDGWLEKNKDPLNDNITQLLTESSETLVKVLFSTELGMSTTKSTTGTNTAVNASGSGAGTSALTSSAHERVLKKGIFRTVAQRHKEQLTHLMSQLNATHPHFVRCIIPNHTKTPKKLDNNLVLDQLRCNGVLEGIRIARTGYPNRLFFSEFRMRYEVLVTGMPKGYIEGQKACQLILKKLALDENLYKVGLTKVFFKSGVLAELEERRENMVKNIIIQFQAYARGSLQRQRIRKTLFKVQATSIIKKNFETYLELRENPWWKLYIKMGPLLLANQDTGRSKAQDLAIKRLEERVKTMKKEHEEINEVQRKKDIELENILTILEGERQIALDKEEILKRAQQHEVDLEEQLAGALDDLDRLESQCEELLLAKKNVDQEAESWKSELENGAHLISVLEKDKSRLKEQITYLEEQLEEDTTIQSAQKTEIEALVSEKEMLQAQLAESEERIKILEARLQEAEERLSVMTKDSTQQLDSSQVKIKELTGQIHEYRQQLDDQYQAAQEYEDDIERKDRDIEKMRATLDQKQKQIEDLNDSCKSMEAEHKKLLNAIVHAEEELSASKARCAKLEAAEKEARRIIEAKVSDESKQDEGRRLLGMKVDELNTALQKQGESFATERKKLLGEVSEKSSHIDKLRHEKEKLSENISKLHGIEEAKKKLEVELANAREKASNAASARGEIAVLKERLNDTETHLRKAKTHNDELSVKLGEANSNVDKIKNELDVVVHERNQLNAQVSQLKRFIDDDLANKENLVLEKNKITQDLQSAQKELETLKFEHQKVVTELNKKNQNMRKLRSSFTDEAMTQRTKLNKEREELEANERRLREQLEAVNLMTETLKKQKEKLGQEIEDLKHDVAREQKVSSAAQLAKTSLETQVQQLKKTVDQQRRDNSESQVLKRKLTANVESLQKELKDKDQQLAVLQKVIKPGTHARSQSVNEKDWKTLSGNTDSTVDLARRLDIAEKKRKEAEDSKALLQAQLDALRKENSSRPHSPIKSSSSVHTLFDDSNRSISASSSINSSPTRSLKTTNGIKSAIDSIYQSFEKDEQAFNSSSKPAPSPLPGFSRGHFRNRSLQQSHFERSKENKDTHGIYGSREFGNALNKIPSIPPSNSSSFTMPTAPQTPIDDASVQESVKSLNIKNKSIEEIEGLIASYESSKRDLRSIFQENSKKLLDAQNKLASVEQEKGKLTAEVDRLKSKSTSGYNDEDVDGLRSTISDLEIRLDAESSRSKELDDGLKLYKSRADEYYSKIESAETIVLKATRAEAFAKAQWKEIDASMRNVLAENKKHEEQNLTLQARVQQLEDQLEDSVVDSNHFQEAQKRLAREISDLTEKRKQDAADMETALTTMRNRYKEEIKLLSEELEQEKIRKGELQTAHRHLTHELEMHKVKSKFEGLDPSWNTFKTQLENKVKELTKTNEEAVLAHRDSQKRIGSLLSQVRTMRATQQELAASRDQVENEKKVLENRLNEALQHVEELAQHPGSTFDIDRASSADDEESADTLKMRLRAQSEAMNATEAKLEDISLQLKSEREELELAKSRKVAADRENQTLHLKVVDLEAQLLGRTSQQGANGGLDSSELKARIAELEQRLDARSAASTAAERAARAAERSVKELQGVVSSRERAAQRTKEELERFESKVKTMQETIETLQAAETTQRLAARRAERESKDGKEAVLRLQRDLEEWKSRYETLVANKRQSRMVV